MLYFGHSVVNAFRSQIPRGFYDPIKGHTGVDLDLPLGSPVSLPIEMTVVGVMDQPEMGLTLYMRDSQGLILVFAHLSHILVHVGDSVAPETVLALSGNSGRATTGAHLHFEVIAPTPEVGLEMMQRQLGAFSGFNIDPVKYLDSIYSHWADSALSWAATHDLIRKPKSPNAPVTWGELAVFSRRLAERLIQWTRNPPPNS